MHRKRACAFFLTFIGRVPGNSIIKALANEIGQAEARGRAEMLRTVREVVGEEAWSSILQRVAERRSVTSSDGVAQPAEDVADGRGTTANAVVGHIDARRS